MPDDDLDPTDTGTDDLDPDDTGTEPVAEPPKPTAPASKVPTQGREPKIDGDFDPERAKRTIARLRAESDAEKKRATDAEARSQDILKKAAAALGLAEEDKPDPDKLTAQLAAAEADARQRRVDLQVLRISPNLGADADMLLDSTAFARDIKDLDPNGAGFREDLTDAITDFLTKHPRYKAQVSAKAEPADDAEEKKPAKAPGRSGADLNGQGTKPRQVTQAELAKMSPKEIVDARAKGLLDNLLNG